MNFRDITSVLQGWKIKFGKMPKTLKNDIFGSQNDHFWSFLKVLAFFKISFSSLQHPNRNAVFS